jgi:hypothetical protein
MTNDNTTTNFEKLEFWALTALFVIGLPINIAPEHTTDFHRGFSDMLQGLQGLNYYSNYLIPAVTRYVVIFLAFLYINFRLLPALLRKKLSSRNILLTIGLIVLVFGLHFLTGLAHFISVNDSYYTIANRALLDTMVVLAGFGGYSLVRYAGLYIISKATGIQAFLIIFNRDSLLILALWMIITYGLSVIDIPIELWFPWFSVIPSGILLHGLAFHWLIPSSLRAKYPLISYFFKVLIFCILINFAIALPIMVASGSEDHAFLNGSLTAVFHFMVTAPGLWLIYRWQMRGREQIFALQTELGNSAANLDFLRSQINPHFLFNALNTIYGLAIQEKAQRTSEAVEKLGEMMRFMLNENTQQRILLNREIEYLNNYISLQKLRTDTNPALRIEVDIPAEVAPVARITPMLLIPFVENAFKHGISLREDSYIKIYLELKNTTLYFDVLNSKHSKSDNDPEKDSNGIGLANVRDRLQHLYPSRHDLLIRETGRDFIVHLRLELD